MKVAILSDTHFGARSDSQIFHDYFGKFYSELFFPTLDKLNIKQIVHPGDLVDRRKYINFNTLNWIHKNFLDPMRQRGIKMKITVGNHDTYFKNTNEVNALDQLFGDAEDITTYTEATEVVVGGCPILFIPWINMNNYDRSLAMIKKSKSKIAIGHLELSGFYMMNGIKNEDGMDKKIFKKFSKVFTGHYHHKSDDGKIFYVGAPYEMTFSDMNDPRGFHIFDTKTNELQFIQNPFRIFFKVYYDDAEKSFDELCSAFDFEKYTGSYVKVIVTRKTNPNYYDQFLNKLYQVNPADISVVEEFDYNSLDEENSVDLAEDTLSILGKYVDGMELDVDKAKIKEHLRTLYIEASNADKMNDNI